MVQVLFSFDTEDYTAPYSDDAILRLADILTEEGVTGCFNLVGELARVLRERGRTDVIEALKRHQINYHTMYHSWHPTMVEYTDQENWEQGYDRLLEEEKRGVQIVKEVFGLSGMCAFVPPGNTIVSQAIYAFRELGMPVYSGSLFKGTGGRSIWYGDTLNLENNCYLDDMLLAQDLDGLGQRLEEYSKWERVIICMHPNIIHYEAFWDAVNMKGGNQVPWGQWRLPQERPRETIERFYRDFRTAIRMFKEDGRFTFVTYGDIWESERKHERRAIPLPLLRSLLAAARGRFFYQKDGADSFSLAELFHAAAFYAGGGAGLYWTDRLVGPLYAPEGVAEPVTVSARQIRAAAAQLAAGRNVPHHIELAAEQDGEISCTIGPRDFMEAAAQLLEGRSVIALSPLPQMPDITDYYRLNDFRLAGTWMHPDSFRDDWVTARLKWQAWTIRSAI